MNREETKKLLDEEADMQSVKVHFVNGGEVEYWINPEWFPIDTPSWCPGIKYRVALKPPADIYVGVDMVNNNFTTPSAMPNSIFTHGNENLKLCHYRLVE